MMRPKQRNFKYSVREPRWSAADRSSIDCLVKFEHLPREASFTASPYDCAPHGQEIYRRCVAGEFGDIAPFQPPPPRPPMPVEAPAALNGFWNSPAGQELAGEISRHNEEVASGSSRGIAAHAEAVLSDRLANLLRNAGVSPRAAKKLSFARKIKDAAARDLISEKEKIALDLLRKIRNEVAHEKIGTFYTETVSELCNSLRECLANYVTYQQAKSLDDRWIDLIFINAYTILSSSQEARANPNMHARIVN